MAEKLNPNANPQTEISDEELDSITGGSNAKGCLPCPGCRSDEFLTKDLIVTHCNNCGCNFVYVGSKYRIISYTK